MLIVLIYKDKPLTQKSEKKKLMHTLILSAYLL